MTNSTSNAFPYNGFLRITQIVGDTKAQPPIPPLIPIGRSTWWRWVQEGKAPAPIKLGPRTTVWRAEEIAALLREMSEGQPRK